MNYDQYLTIARRLGYTGQRLYLLARTAMLLSAKHNRGNLYVKQNLRALPEFQECPALLAVPRRVLSRWAWRAMKATLSKDELLTGPRLAMYRRGIRW
jgi:hypothetical protein